MDFRKSELFTLDGDNFIVQAKHWVELSYKGMQAFNDGRNRWAIYAYIYPKHKLFAEIKADGGMWQDAFNDLPLHRGCSYFKRHIDDESGKTTSYQIGCDYNHHGDDEFTYMKDERDAWGVLEDARRLFKVLSND